MDAEKIHLEAHYVPYSATVSWFFNGQPLQQAHRFQMMSDLGYIFLNILYCYPEDSGTYTCRISNDLGQAECSSVVTVESKPSIIYERQAPQETTADLMRIFAQYTKAEILLTDADFHSIPYYILAKPSIIFERQAPQETTADLMRIFAQYTKAEILLTDADFHSIPYYILAKPSIIFERQAPQETTADLMRIFAQYTKAEILLTDADFHSIPYYILAKPSIIFERQAPQETTADLMRIFAQYTKAEILLTDADFHSIPYYILAKPSIIFERQAPQETTADLMRIFAQYTKAEILLTDADFHSIPYYILAKPSIIFERQAPQETTADLMRIFAQYTKAEILLTDADFHSIPYYILAKPSIIFERQAPQETTADLMRIFAQYTKAEILLTDADFHSIPYYILAKPSIIFERQAPQETTADLMRIFAQYTKAEILLTDADFHSIPYYILAKPSIIFERQAPQETTADLMRIFAQYTKAEILLTDADFHSIPYYILAKPSIIFERQAPQETTTDLMRIFAQYTKAEILLTDADFHSIPYYILAKPSIIFERQAPQETTADLMRIFAQYTKAEILLTDADFHSIPYYILAKPSIIFERQAPQETTADLMRIFAQYTKAEILLTDADFYVDDQKQQPVFKSLIQNQTIYEGDFVRFEAQLGPINDPHMRIDWFCNGQPIMLGHRFRPTLDHGYVALDLLYGLPEDSGEYTARATNRYGSVESTATLIVGGKNRVITAKALPQGWTVAGMKGLEKKEQQAIYWSHETEIGDRQIEKCAPSFTIKPRPLQVLENEPARFECAVSGNPKPRITWFVNGREAMKGSRYKLSFDGMFYLLIPQVRPSDAGEILCVAKNNLGECQSTTSLDVFLLNDFRSHQLKKSNFSVTTAEIMDKEAKWKRDAMGDLDEVFRSRPRPDIQRMVQVEFQRPLPEPLETPELRNIFERERDENYWAKLVESEHVKHEFEPSQLEAVTLKPAAITKYQPPTTELEKVALRAAPRLDATQDIPENASWMGQQTLSGFSEEEAKKKFKIFSPPPKQEDLAAKDQVKLQPVQPKAPEITDEYEAVYAVEPKVRVRVPEQFAMMPREEVIAHKHQVQLKQVYAGDSAQQRAKQQQEQQQQQQTTTTTTTTEGQESLHTTELKPAQIEEKQAFESGKVEGTSTTVLTSRRNFHSNNREMQLIQTHSQHSNLNDDVIQNGVPTAGGATSRKVKAPTFRQELQASSVEMGKNCKFFVTFDGGQPINVLWMRGGRPIGQSFDFQVKSGVNSSTLEINRVRMDMADEYSVQISNPGGIYVSKATLNVLERTDLGAAPTFIEPLDNCVTQQEKQAVMKAKVSGKPTVVTWFKDGRQIMSDKRVRLQVESDIYKMTIAEAVPADAGFYEIVARNMKGEARSKAQMLVQKPGETAPPGGLTTRRRHGKTETQTSSTTTTDTKTQRKAGDRAPEIVDPIRPAVVQEGKPVKLTARIKAMPEPEVKWFRGSAQITPDKFIQTSYNKGVAMLMINKAGVEDSGDYKLEVKNDVGSTSCTASIKIQASKTKSPGGTGPQFKSPLQPQLVSPGQSATFIVECSADPSYTWSLNGKELKNSDATKISAVPGGSKLEIPNMSPEFVGKISVKATNKVGVAEATADLKMLEE